MPKKLTKEEFIQKAKLVHGDKYDYSDVDYINANNKININCHEHGVFKQLPSSHLFGKGCLKCSSTRAKTSDEFIKNAINKHGLKYNYSLLKYKNSHTKVKILCPIHGEFELSPTNHLCGQGCLECGKIKLSELATKNSYGWSLNQWTNKIALDTNATPRLYVLKCYNDFEEFIKIGITMRTIKKRYHSKTSMPYNYDVLLDIENDSTSIFKKEKELIKILKEFKYSPKLKFNGKNECFIIKSTELIIKTIIK